MEKEILKLIMKKGFLVDKEMLNFLNELNEEEIINQIINRIAITSKKKLITKGLINENIGIIKHLFLNLNSEKKKIIERYFVNISFELKKETSFEMEEENEKNFEILNQIKVLSSSILPPKKLEVRDFVKHFKNRYNFLKGILQEKTELDNLISIDKISGNRGFSIIGIITNKFITKNKNIILEVEDLTGKTKLLISQNKEEVFEKSKELLVDDVVGFKCSGTRDFLFVNDLFYPDIFLQEKHKTDDEIYALFISDMHIGSKNFLEKNFNKFIEWLSGVGSNEKQKNFLKKIRYFFVVGDSIDGVGIYPGQEIALKIKDIKEQYKLLTEFYKKIPKHISIIQCAGQHDAVRVAEPQPPIGKDFGEQLHDIENLFLVSNPSLIEIENNNGKPGVKILMYHGASMHHIINEIEELRLNNAHGTPSRVVKHLLLRRHLSPCHGNAIYIPSLEEDPLLIKEVPDIIATGDLHKTDIDNYNGISIICCSCWQSITDFEEKVGNQPDPCKVPILNLKTGEIKVLDFS